jgi:hypothetical protein
MAETEMTTFQRVTEYQVSALPDDLCVDCYAWAVTVAWRGKDRWAVTHHGRCLGPDGWDYEMQPSSRMDEWLNEHRFGEQEALRLAHEVAPRICINGLTPADLLEKYRGSNAG